jgi:hypothetical protein
MITPSKAISHRAHKGTKKIGKTKIRHRDAETQRYTEKGKKSFKENQRHKALIYPP